MDKIINENIQTIYPEEKKIPIPDNYTIVEQVLGDLDKDSVKELVVAYNAGPTDEFNGVTRELIIYKLENDKWVEWVKSKQALYGSQDGGMMGDPFEKIEIKNGLLLISHYGGSNWKWAFTDKYRFQNGDFHLIGFSSLSGMYCEYWKDVDFNLSTGKMIVKKEFEKCETQDQIIYKKENEIFYKKDLKVTLQNRLEKEIKITTPKYGHEIYVAMKHE